MNMNKKYYSRTSLICTVISVVYLLSRLYDDVIVKGLPVLEAFFKDPVGYITVFVPLGVGWFSLFINAVKDVNKVLIDKRYVGYVIETVSMLVWATLEFKVIMHYSMNTGFISFEKVDGRYLQGLFIIIAFCAVVSFLFSIDDLDFDTWWEGFSGALLISWIIMSAINGFVDASAILRYYHIQSTFLWIVLSIGMGIINGYFGELVLLCAIAWFLLFHVLFGY